MRRAIGSPLGKGDSLRNLFWDGQGGPNLVFVGLMRLALSLRLTQRTWNIVLYSEETYS